MHRIDRRIVVAGLALLSMGRGARAGAPDQLSVEADDGSVAFTRYAADRPAAGPA